MLTKQEKFSMIEQQTNSHDELGELLSKLEKMERIEKSRSLWKKKVESLKAKTKVEVEELSWKKDKSFRSEDESALYFSINKFIPNSMSISISLKGPLQASYKAVILQRMKSLFEGLEKMTRGGQVHFEVNTNENIFAGHLLIKEIKSKDALESLKTICDDKKIKLKNINGMVWFTFKSKIKKRQKKEYHSLYEVGL